MASAATPVPASAPAAAATGDDAPWTLATAADDYGAGRAHFEYLVSPGDRVDDGLVVTNTGAQPLDLTVYPADAFTTESGALDLRTAAEPATGVGAWLAPGTRHVTVAPGRSADVPFALVVPADAPTGDHVGGIVTSRTTTVGGQRVEQRVALQVQLHLAGLFRPGLAVEDLHTTYAGPTVGSGDATVTYTLRNTGNVVLSAHQSVTVAGPLGLLAARAGAVADPPPLLPGESWPVSVPVHGVVRGGWSATSVSLVPVYTDPAGSSDEFAAVGAATHTWALSWLVVVVALVVLAAAVGLVVLVVRLVGRGRTRRRTAAEPDRPAQPVTSLPENLAHAASRKTTT